MSLAQKIEYKRQWIVCLSLQMYCYLFGYYIVTLVNKGNMKDYFATKQFH